MKSKSDLEQSWEKGQLVKWQMTGGMMDSEGTRNEESRQNKNGEMKGGAGREDRERI